MAAEKITEVQLESIRLLEAKGRTVSAEPINTYVQVVLSSYSYVNNDFNICSVQFSKAICIALLRRMSHCAPATRKLVRFVAHWLLSFSESGTQIDVMKLL